MQDAQGDPLKPVKRFSAYQLAQRLLAHRTGCAILFDEIEDVFPTHGLFRDPDDGKKAWITRLLENNSTPALWLCNEVRQIDPAILRRFDYVLELRPPIRSVRRKLLTTYMGDLPVGESWFDRMADNEHLAPAQIERAAKVVRALPRTDTDKTERTLERVLDNTLRLMGAPRSVMGGTSATVAYSMNLINADTDMPSLVTGLRESGYGRLCFYGAPGTGKTAFATHLAKLIDRPLIKKRASDLLSMWVGGSEKLTAQLFERGRDEQAVLLLDEADSFLQDRSRASASWEVSLVNEWLVQMEAYDGIFIASTNLMDLMDQATFRRFDVKVRFDYMTAQQAVMVLRSIMTQDREMCADELAVIQPRLHRLMNLSLGDFAALVRKREVMAVRWSAMDWIEELEQACVLKPDGRKHSLGFATT